MAFDRRYILDFGEPYVPALPSSPNIITPFSPEGYIQYTQTTLSEQLERAFYSEDQGRRITGLNIAFDIEKAKDDSSKCEITAYNLSDHSVGILENNSGLQTFIRLRAGYADGDLRQLFQGVVEKVEDNFIGQDRVTVITCTDNSSLRWALSAREYPKGTSYRYILETLLEDAGMPIGMFEGEPLARITTRPIYLYGRTQELIYQMADWLKLEVSTQDLAIYISERNKVSGGERATILTTDTGIIGSVSFLDDTVSSSPTEATESQKGIKFTHLLRGDIQTHQAIIVKSRNVDGIYKVTKVKHRGEYEGSDWFTEVEAEVTDLELV